MLDATLVGDGYRGSIAKVGAPEVHILAVGAVRVPAHKTMRVCAVCLNAVVPIDVRQINSSG